MRTEYWVEDIIGRVFLTAHLMAANIEHAERAVCEAIDSFDPDRDTEKDLLHDAFRAVVRCAAGQAHPSSSNHRDGHGWSLPDELQAVLNLSPKPRQCYVLRVLAGLSPCACAELLGLDLDAVDRFTYGALRRLAGFDPF